MQEHSLSWEDLGDVRTGRPNLGPHTTVTYYRLAQMSMATELVGRLVHSQFLSSCTDMPSLVRELTRFLKEHNVGILRVEEANEETREFVFTIREDLDCSGTPNDGRFKCKFDEGLVTGVLAGFFDRDMYVEEVECWGRGQTTCRFSARPTGAVPELRLSVG
jgi:uncharacterized protein